MRTCSAKGGCKKSEYEVEFYDQPKVRLCKACILKVRSERKYSERIHIDRAERAQDAILAFVAGAQKDGTEFVYLLDSGQAYKIGYSSNIAARVRAFKTAHAHKYPIRVLAVVPGGQLLEQRLHCDLQCFHKVREWFKRKQEIIATIAALPGALVFIPPYLGPEDPAQSSVIDSPRLLHPRKSA